MPSIEEEQFRHSGWHNDREAIFHAMEAAHISCSRLERFVSCGANCRVLFNQTTGEVRLQGSCCHDRMCRPCAAARGRILQAAIHAHIPKSARLRFITLTLKHSSLPLAAVLKRLRDAFSTLRNRKLWKDHVKGGVAVLEVKLSKSGFWHPHLHIMVEGSYLPREDLSAAWHEITGDSYIVDIRKVDDAEDDARELARYVTKYICKPAGLELLNDTEKLCEYICAMKGQRVLNFLGSWRGILTDEEQEQDERLTAENGWQQLGSLTDFIRQARAGDKAAKAVMLAVLAREVASPEPRSLIPEAPD